MDTTAQVNISLEQKIKNLQTATWHVAMQCEKEHRILAANQLTGVCEGFKRARDNLGILGPSHD